MFAYRVDFHDGDEELAPGITVHKIGGHSKGLQCVRVKTQRGYVVVASDACHLYSHIDEGRVFPITYSVGDTLEGYKTLQKLASSRHHIVPGHDPEVMKIYPAAKAGLERLGRRGWTRSRRCNFCPPEAGPIRRSLSPSLRAPKERSNAVPHASDALRASPA